MTNSRFTEEQIIAVLKEDDAAAKARDLTARSESASTPFTAGKFAAHPQAHRRVGREARDAPTRPDERRSMDFVSDAPLLWADFRLKPGSPLASAGRYPGARFNLILDPAVSDRLGVLSESNAGWPIGAFAATR